MKHDSDQIPKINIENFLPCISRYTANEYSAVEYSRAGLPAMIHSREIFSQMEQIIINDLDEILLNSLKENILLFKIKYLPKTDFQKNNPDEKTLTDIYFETASQLLHSPKIAQQGTILITRAPFIASEGEFGVKDIAQYIDNFLYQMELYQKKPRENGMQGFKRPEKIERVIILDTTVEEENSRIGKTDFSKNTFYVYLTPINLSPEDLEEISLIVSPKTNIQKIIKKIKRMVSFIEI